MDFDEIKRKQHLRPVSIPNKDNLLRDLYNIEHSTTGRADAYIANTFIYESCYLIINSITLFEKGYFDCAYYSLRQSIETATTMIYLTDIGEDVKQDDARRKWNSESHFPMYRQMIEYLEENGRSFAELKDKFSEFFDEVAKTKKRMDKFVHKQGFDKLYFSRNHPMNPKLKEKSFVTDFESRVRQCISTVAIMRLTIDPFPILLEDEEIYSRTGDLLTDPFSKSFIEQYIGEELLQLYRETKLYRTHHEFFMEHERQSEAVSDVIKNQFVDTSKFEDIFTQAHLLDPLALLGVASLRSSEKITKFYISGGLIQYFSDRNTRREKMSWSSEDFTQFEAASPPYNCGYDEVYISVIEVSGEKLFVEHNEKLTEPELKTIISYADDLNSMFSEKPIS